MRLLQDLLCPREILERIGSRSLKDGALQFSEGLLGGAGIDELCCEHGRALLLDNLSLRLRLWQEIIVDLFPTPLVMIEHAKKLPASHRTAPATLNLRDQVASAPVIPPGLNATDPTLQLRDGPQHARPSAPHVLLVYRVKLLKQ